MNYTWLVSGIIALVGWIASLAGLWIRMQDRIAQQDREISVIRTDLAHTQAHINRVETAAQQQYAKLDTEIRELRNTIKEEMASLKRDYLSVIIEGLKKT